MYLFQQLTLLVFIIFSTVNCFQIPFFHYNSEEKDYSSPANTNLVKIVQIYSLDPLYLNYTEGQISELKYKLYDINLFNLRQCRILKLAFDDKRQTFKEDWACPSFYINFNNDAVGKFVDVSICKQKGYIEIRTEKVKITFSGSNKESVINNKTYDTIGDPKITAKAIGHVTMQNYTVTEGDQAQSDKARANFNGKDQKTGVEFTEKLIALLLTEKYFPALKEYINNKSTDETLRVWSSSLPNNKDLSGPANKNFIDIIEKYDLDPIYEDTTKGQVSRLNYTLSDVYLANLKQCYITKLMFHTKNLIHTFEEIWECPSFLFSFKNDVVGCYGDVDLTGEQGFIEIKTGKIKVKFTGNFNLIKRDNQTYYTIENPKLTANTNEHVEAQNYTLTVGDQETADLARKNFNTVDQGISKDFTTNMIADLLLKFYVKSFKLYMNSKPIDYTLLTT